MITTIESTTQIATIAAQPDLLAQNASWDPDGIAVSVGDRDLTNEELDRGTNRLARVLIAAGVTPGAQVALALAPSIESVVGMWAILKAGATCVPTDGANVVPMSSIGITTRENRPQLSNSVEWIVLDDPATLLAVRAVANVPISDYDQLVEMESNVG
jgi:acyl-CoA synthetase (AMP-forming)/AMP-acid ligase II